MAVRPKTWGILGSLSLHGVLAVLAIHLAVQEGMVRLRQRPPDRAAGWAWASADGELRGFPLDRPIDAPVQDVEKLLQAAEAGRGRLTKQQQKEALRGKTDMLKQFPTAHVDQVANLVEALKGVDQKRQWAPRPGVSGTYDVDSSVLHDIRKTVLDGKTVYVFTMIDKDGRSMTANVDDSQMTPEDLTTFQLYELARKNEGLRRLMEAAAKIHETQNPQKK